MTARPAYRHLVAVFADGAGTPVNPLCGQGDVSLGPTRAGRATLERLDTDPRWTGLPALEDAGPRAILAYLRTHGPATTDHLH